MLLQHWECLLPLGRMLRELRAVTQIMMTKGRSDSFVACMERFGRAGGEAPINFYTKVPPKLQYLLL